MTTLYEDDKVEVHLPREAFCKGHMFVRCKGDAVILEEVHTEVLKHAFFVANQMSSVLFEVLECDGTNILVQNGLDAGQVDEAVIVHVIPRWKGDDLNFEWHKEEAGETELEDALSSYTFVEENQRAEQYAEQKKKDFENTTSKESEKIRGEEDYYVKQLRRRL